MTFQKLSIEEYQQLLESKKSTPSGGSALALTLETAASLCLMVCNLTINKKGYEEVYNQIEKYIDDIKLVKEESKKLMDEDSIAFDALMNAFRSKDEQEIQMKAIDAAMVPYKLFCETEKLQLIAESLKEIGNKSVQSDAIIAIDLCKAIYNGSVLNIKANLPYITDKEIIEKLVSIID